MKRQDLSGQRFGKLIAEEYLGGGKWRCKCDCGNITVVLSSNLTRIHTTSCGCAKGTGIIGHIFGNLTVISKDSVNGKAVYYKCQCACGNTAIRRYESLVSGHSQRCDECNSQIRTAVVRERVFVDGTQPSRIVLDRPLSKANKSGFVGVNWDKSRQKWQAGIKFKGKRYNLGRYENLQDAIDARKAAEEYIYGPFIEWYESKYKKSAED